MNVVADFGCPKALPGTTSHTYPSGVTSHAYPSGVTRHAHSSGATSHTYPSGVRDCSTVQPPAAEATKPHPPICSEDDQDLPYGRPRSRRIQKKPTILPRNKGKNTAAVADSNSTPGKGSHSMDRGSHSSSKVALHEGQFAERFYHRRRYSSSDYIHNSIPVGGKPIPVPRSPRTLGVKSSAKASMVTMGIGHWSSSESNLLETVFSDYLSPGGGVQWEHDTSIRHKFHSSSEINT